MTREADIQYTPQLERMLGFLEIDPENVPLLLNVGDLLHQSGDLAGAEDAYNRILDCQPGHGVASSRLAGVLISRHRFDEAEAVLQLLVSQAPDVAALNHNLGIALIYQSKWAEALEAFERAAAGGVTEAENTMYQAYCLHSLGRTGEALIKATLVLEQAPSEQTAGHVAILQLDVGDLNSARRTATQLVKSSPRSIEGNLVLGALDLELQEIDDAFKRISLVLEQDPENPRALLSDGLVKLYNQQSPEAIQSFERALEHMPKNTGVWVTLGWAHLANNDLQSAEETFRKAIEVDRNFGESHGGLATVLALAERDAEAREVLDRARGLNRDSFGAAFALSILLEHQGKRAAATKILGTAFTKSPRKGGMTVIEAINIFTRRQAARQGSIRLPKPSPRGK